jgi:hypothetical protein
MSMWQIVAPPFGGFFSMSMWHNVAPLRGTTGGMSMIRGPTTSSM